MNSYKVMQTHEKSIKATCLSYSGGWGGHVKCLGAKNRLTDGKEMNTVFTSVVAKALKMKKKSKYKYNSNLEDELEQFNFQKPNIEADYNL